MIARYEFITYTKEDDGLTDLHSNISGSLIFLKQILSGETKNCIGYDHYVSMIDFLKANHPELLL